MVLAELQTRTSHISYSAALGDIKQRRHASEISWRSRSDNLAVRVSQVCAFACLNQCALRRVH